MKIQVHGNLKTDKPMTSVENTSEPITNPQMRGGGEEER
jgi:hypothetical protein